MSDSTSSVWLKGAGLILWLALMGALAWLAMEKGWFEPQRIQGLLENLGARAPLVFIGLMAFAVVSTFFLSWSWWRFFSGSDLDQTQESLRPL